MSLRLLKIIILAGTIILFTSVALASESYRSDKVYFAFNDNGDWELYDSVNDISYIGEWHGSLMKVTGSDGTCYWLAETSEGLEQSGCDLKSVSILIYKISAT